MRKGPSQQHLCWSQAFLIASHRWENRICLFRCFFFYSHKHLTLILPHSGLWWMPSQSMGVGWEKWRTWVNHCRHQKKWNVVCVCVCVCIRCVCVCVCVQCDYDGIQLHFLVCTLCTTAFCITPSIRTINLWPSLVPTFTCSWNNFCHKGDKTKGSNKLVMIKNLIISSNNNIWGSQIQNNVVKRL